MKICIVGAGYVGLVTAACFSEMGHTVVCIEKDETKFNKLKNNIVPIYEPGLEELVIRNSEKKLLNFTRNISEGLAQSSVVFIAVGTPQGEDGTADLRYVLGVAAEIGSSLEHDIIVVNKSTVPVGTAHKVHAIIEEKLKLRNKSHIKFDVASNPEFLKEGDALNDFFRPDRIVIGARNESTFDVLKELYANFVKNGNPIITMDVQSAEITKYASNAMLATRISFMNELSHLCDEVGADIEKVRTGMGADKRIGMSFLYAGLGYGGSCFPKDVKALKRTMEELGIEHTLLKSVDEVNAVQVPKFFNKILKHYENNINGKTFGIWGLAFKPKTDDVRESQAVALIKMLIEHGAAVKIHDPEALEHLDFCFNKHPAVTGHKDKYEVLTKSDALILATEWAEYRNPDFETIAHLLKEKVIFDGRNQFNPDRMKQQGWAYTCIGRH